MPQSLTVLIVLIILWHHSIAWLQVGIFLDTKITKHAHKESKMFYLAKCTIRLQAAGSWRDSKLHSVSIWKPHSLSKLNRTKHFEIINLEKYTMRSIQLQKQQPQARASRDLLKLHGKQFQPLGSYKLKPTYGLQVFSIHKPRNISKNCFKNKIQLPFIIYQEVVQQIWYFFIT